MGLCGKLFGAAHRQTEKKIYTFINRPSSSKHVPANTMRHTDILCILFYLNICFLLLMFNKHMQFKSNNLYHHFSEKAGVTIYYVGGGGCPWNFSLDTGGLGGKKVDKPLL